MVSVVLFMIMLSGMSLVLLSVILGQLGPGYAAQKSTKTVYSAQAGLQSALSAVRSATKTVGGKTVGDLSKLPCKVKASIDGGDSTIGYTAQINYYLQDPTGRSEAWLNSSANKLICNSANYTGSTQPQYAYIVASGYGESVPQRDANESNRSVAAVYKFQISNVNIPGGRIFTYDGSACLQADSTTAGSKVQFLAASYCASNNDRQLWAYGTDWKIKLASTIVNAGDVGLCVTARSGQNSDFATLETCVTSPTASHSKQLFSWNGNSGWSGQNAANTASSGCLTRANAKVGSVTSSYLMVTGACVQFAPAPAVGAGAASYATRQIVNYKEFGRCLDVTDTNINKSFMITYPCKQDPTGNNGFDWNHKWNYTEPNVAGGQTSLGNQQIIVNYNNKNYCLTTPTQSPSSKYPTFTECKSSEQRQRWTRVNKKSGDYAGSYLFTDTYGRCLAADAGDKMRTDAGALTNWSKVTVTSCNGGLEQKWNAPAIETGAEFGGFKETDGYKDLG